MTAPGPASADPPALRLAAPGLLFDARGARFGALAASHAAPEWLRFLSQLAHGQAVAVRDVRPARPHAVAEGPPLAPERLPRDDAWRRMLAVVVSQLRTDGLPAETRAAVARVAGLAPARLEELAGALLGGSFPPEEAACAPFLGAALQAWLAALAAGLDPAAFAPATAACPVCGGPPVAGLVQGNDRLRYVTCALCTAEWNVVRARCVSCDTAAAPEYLHVGSEKGAKAEACPTCRSYVKVFDQLVRPGADPAADDAATIALDLLLAEEGWLRAGPNLYVGGE